MNKTTVMAKGTLNKLLCFILMTGLFSCGDTKSTNNMSKEDKQVVTEKKSSKSNLQRTKS
ncbi:MAG: hypothetical protein IPP77_05095 [Bacteroidetes bacterium]|nr:hypothetical protein [Bacteroidota bacterium]